MNEQDRIAADVEWRPMPDSEGRYEVSSAGGIRRLEGGEAKLLPAYLNNSGYLRVHVRLHGKPKFLYVHHLVACAFIGPRPSGLDVNHCNGRKTDNRASNLEYASRWENMQHARRLGLHDNRGSKHYGAKLNEEAVLDILWANSSCGLNGSDLAPHFGVSPGTINDVITRRTWRHVVP